MVSSHPARTAYSSLSPPHGRLMVPAEVLCFSRYLSPWNISPHSWWPGIDFSFSFALQLHRDRYGQYPMHRVHGAESCTGCAKTGFLAGGICREIQSCKCPGSLMSHQLVSNVIPFNLQSLFSVMITRGAFSFTDML